MGLWDWVTENPLDALEGTLLLYNTIKGNQAADSAADNAAALTQSDIERNNTIYELFSEGGNQLRDNLQALLTEYGDFGQVTPTTVNAMTNYFASQRASEEAANKQTIDQLTVEDIMRLKGMEGAYRDYAQTHLERGDETVFGADAQAKMDAPGTFDFAQMQDMLTAQFANMRASNTNRALNDQYAKASASLPPGMENSTLRVQMERSFADQAAERRNQDMMAAITDAQNYIGGLQQATSNQQNITNAERNMMRNLVGDALNYGTQTMNNALSGGAYGQDFANEIDAQYGRNISETSALQGMRNNTALNDFLTGLSSVDAENKLANTYLNQIQNLTTAPYSYTAKGMGGISNQAAMDSLSNIATSAANLSAGNMKAAGGWWDNIRKKYSF